jgi:LuxR family maltose regulon positive regulatory protein
MRQESETADGARLLIGAKVEVPKPPPGLVTRPHLIDRLDRGRSGRVTLVSAPAGYGKTTLVG